MVIHALVNGHIIHKNKGKKKCGIVVKTRQADLSISQTTDMMNMDF